MKKIYSYMIGCAALLTGAAAMTSCQDDFDNPVIEAPVATIKPNMSILELKQMFWNDATNYIDTIGIENGVDDGKDYIISGRVISSDEAGNVFKSLVIQDETAALALSINSYNLYLKYRQGQEIVIDLKGMYIGKYNGLVQLGMPEWYEAGSAWEATFMAPEFFEMHKQLNGFPEIEKIDTLEVNSFDELPSNPDGLCRWQSQLVKFNNVSFQNGGTQQFSEYHSSGVNQNIVDVNGNTLPVRTSGYSNFWNNYLPEGNGDVVALLSYYGTTGWQLLLNDYEGCMNFGNPTVAPGTHDKPYSVMEAIATINSGKQKSGWVAGYIVGAVAPEVTEVKSNSDIEWAADPVLDNTLVIGATPDTKDISQALIISLPAGSSLRQYGNLVSHPENYKRSIMVKGTFGKYMGSFGILDNNGKTGEWEIDGVEAGGSGAAAGTGTEDSPYNVQQVIAKNPTGNADAPDESNVWVRGYIVGWADMSSTYYINAETARFSVPATMNTNILLAPTPDVDDYSKCIGIQLPSGAVRSALNLVDNPANLGREIEILGNIAKYSGVPGLRSASQFKWIGDAPENPDTPVTPDPGTGAGTLEAPYSVADVVAGKTGTGVWVKCYIVGWIDGMTLSSGATFNGSATANTNILVADSPSETDLAKCAPVQLPSGAVRTALNLVDNPGNYKKEVLLCGSLEKYFGAPGIKSVTDYKLDGSGAVTPPAADGVKFRKVSAVTSGKQYLIVASGKAATPLTANYGYLKVVDVAANGDEIVADAANAFTFTKSGDGFSISAAGKYYYQTGDYNSFNVDTSLPATGGIWKVELNAGAFVITNTATSKTIQFDSQYTSYGCYPDVRGTYPVLYERVD